MQIEHLRYLTAITKLNSMNKAAKHLFVTQPTISNGIKSMENELGYPLLERDGKGVRPTALGKHVLEDAELIIECFDRWKSFAKTASSEQPVSIVFTGSAPRYNIVDAIVRTREKYPDIKVDVSFQRSPDGALSHVNSRIGIQYKVPAHLDDAKRYAEQHGMRLALLQEDEFCVFANRECPIFQSDDVALSDLRSRKVLFYQEADRFPYIDMVRQTGASSSMQMYDEENLMISILLMKDAVALRPSKTAINNPYCSSGQIRVEPFSDCEMPVNLYVSFPAEQRIFKSERLFIENLAACFPAFCMI